MIIGVNNIQKSEVGEKRKRKIQAGWYILVVPVAACKSRYDTKKKERQEKRKERKRANSMYPLPE